MPAAPRLHVPLPLQESGQLIDLPAAAARHAQVLRVQPGDPLTLFDGRSNQEWQSEVTQMTRSGVQVRLKAALPVQTELALPVTLAVVMPANDRMDFLVEKATELGATALQPLVSERSVLRLAGERAEKKRAHWQGVAQAAAEQCGRVRVPAVGLPQALPAWLEALPPSDEGLRWLASPGAARPALLATQALTLLSGPEGGLSAAEEERAIAAGFRRIGLGPRILRADTAPLAVLAALALQL